MSIHDVLSDDDAVWEAADDKRDYCVLCTCESVRTLHGFPVCDYHLLNGEDAPSCPVCAGGAR